MTAEQRALLIGAIKHLEKLHSPAWADAVRAMRDELDAKIASETTGEDQCDVAFLCSACGEHHVR